MHEKVPFSTTKRSSYHYWVKKKIMQNKKNITGSVGFGVLLEQDYGISDLVRFQGEETTKHLLEEFPQGAPNPY